MKRLLPIIIAGTSSIIPLTASAKSATLFSPDKDITVVLEDGSNGLPLLNISLPKKQILTDSEIGLNIKGRKQPLKIKSVKSKKNVKEDIKAPFHHTPEFSVEYNEMAADLGDGLRLTIRAFNDGVAYRFSTDKKGETVILNETANYTLADNPQLYLPFSTNDKKPEAMAFQNFYTKTALESAPDKLAFLPVAADNKSGIKTVILESDLESYPGMFLKADSVKGSLNGVFAKYPKAFEQNAWRQQKYVTATEDFIAKSEGKRDYPWRIFSITADDTEMPTSNLVYALAKPSKISDTSWIKPGKVAWDWWNDWGLRGVDFKAGINTETYKHYIDFASENGIEYIVLDEGWYDPKSGDMLTVVDDIDLPEIIRYGKEKNVDIVLWTVFNVLDSQLAEACKKYSEMGVKGFKVDFLDRDDQEGVEMVKRIAQACADNKLALDLHGIYKPHGLNREYPNIINYEAVFGMEEMKWSDPSVDMPLHDVTFPYIRMMAGPVDFTPGAMRNASKVDWKAIYYNPMSQGTRAHQTASYIVVDSPFTMLADSPSLYRKNQDWVDFVTPIPTVFDATDVIDGTLGEYIVTMREKDGKYYVGGLTNWDARDYDLSFSFLPEGKYTATILTDGVNAAKEADDYKISTSTVDKDSKMKVRMAPGGGFAIRIEPK